MSTYTGVINFQKTVRFFWPTLYIHSRQYSDNQTEVNGEQSMFTTPPCSQYLLWSRPHIWFFDLAHKTV